MWIVVIGNLSIIYLLMIIEILNFHLVDVSIGTAGGCLPKICLYFGSVPAAGCLHKMDLPIDLTIDSGNGVVQFSGMLCFSSIFL